VGTCRCAAHMLQVHIRIREQIDEGWADWLSGLTVSHTRDGETCLPGHVSDQSALYGLLAKLRDLGLSLAEVRREENDRARSGGARDAS